MLLWEIGPQQCVTWRDGCDDGDYKDKNKQIKTLQKSSHFCSHMCQVKSTPWFNFSLSVSLCFVAPLLFPFLFHSIILTKLSKGKRNMHISSAINHHGQMELIALKGQMHHFPQSIILIFH